MLTHVLYPLFRRVDFRGKGRLRARLPVPDHGRVVARFPRGVRLRLDLRESLQRDFYFGLYDQHELRLVTRQLGDGDFVDVGAHIGIYTVTASNALRGRARVLAFEPNPTARAQLMENLELNQCDNVVVVDAAATDTAGTALLHVPASRDPSFSSLAPGRFVEGEPVSVAATTIDEAVAQHALRPAVIKIDVEGGEIDVVRGAQRTVATARPALLIEVNDASAQEVALLLEDYQGFRIARRRLEPLAGGSGLFNAWFLPIRP